MKDSLRKIGYIVLTVFGFLFFGFVHVSALTTDIEEQIRDVFTRMPERTYGYGSASVNYILNDFLPNEKWKEYGKYYICEVHYDSYTNICRMFDDYTQLSVNENNDIILNGVAKEVQIASGSISLVKDMNFNQHGFGIVQPSFYVFRSNLVDYLLDGVEPGSQKYIDISNVKQVEFVFDIEYMQKNLNIDNFYKLQGGFNLELLNEDKMSSFEKFYAPDMQTFSKKNGTNVYINYNLFESDYNYTYNRVDYINNYLFDETTSYEYIKLVVDVSNLNSKYLYANLDVNTPYTINLITDLEDDTSYYKTYQFNNNYAVMLIPYVNRDDGKYEFSSRFVFNENLNVRYINDYSKNFSLEENYVWKKQITENNTVMNIHFTSYETSYRNAIFIINELYKNSSFVYDSRYFTLVELENSSSKPTFLNPNTKEEETFNSDNLEDEADYKLYFKELEKFLNDAKKNQQGFNKLFHSIYDNFPEILKSMILVLYIILHIAICIAVGVA